ncbi:MAG: hypothetical protein AAGG68_05240 [Bacteroidota bacterium]
MKKGNMILANPIYDVVEEVESTIEQYIREKQELADRNIRLSGKNSELSSKNNELEDEISEKDKMIEELKRQLKASKNKD